MYRHLHWFERDGVASVVALPFELEDLIQGWAGLRNAMRRTLPEEFNRDEWAYLMAFLSADQLHKPYCDSFGSCVAASAKIGSLARPRGTVAVWLPNNVSLLGPLSLILLTLTGNRILLKGGSRSNNLTGAFLDFARAHLAEGCLRDVLQQYVHYEVFEHGDARQKRMVEKADVRIVFGGDETAAAIHASADPLKGIGFSFVDRQSQAWIEPEAVTDEVLSTLIRVFAIYGQAGCTSPRRVVLLGGTTQQALALRNRMLTLWPRALPVQPPMHIASGNTLALQWARACGWDAAATGNRSAVIGVGPITMPGIDAPLFLPVSSATLEEAVEHLPPNVQTLGHALNTRPDTRWLEVAATTKVKRLVPIAGMHHFGPLWDGERFWRQCFQDVEVNI